MTIPLYFMNCLKLENSDARGSFCEIGFFLRALRRIDAPIGRIV